MPKLLPSPAMAEPLVVVTFAAVNVVPAPKVTAPEKV